MYKAPIPAASVGVNHPPRMPPRISTGAPSGGRALTNEWRMADQSRGSPTRSVRLRAQIHTVIVSASVIRMAGTTAAANRAPVDTRATDAKTTAGMLGGMIGLIKAELALSPTENSAG